VSKTTKSLEERLDAHPELKEQMIRLLEIAESDIEKADEVEDRTIEGVRGLGKQVLEAWAQLHERMKSKALREEETNVRLHGKKNSTGKAPSGKSR
jgi:flagellin-specific chaperone FliS